MQLLKEILRPFAKSIYIKSRALADLHLTKIQQRRFIESVDDDIKKCSNFFTPEISKFAKVEATKRKIDLFEKCWHDQPKFDQKRRVFHFEHITPVAQIRKTCLRCTSDEKILDVLATIRIAWILKTENDKLTELGYKSKRPTPDVAYQKACINLMKFDSNKSFIGVITLKASII